MNNSTFNEPEWIKLIFMLADTQQWLNELSQQAFEQIPIEHKQQLHKKTYSPSVTALQQIIERHYYKIQRHPGKGEFIISLPVILQHIREAATVSPSPVPGCLHLQRILQTSEHIAVVKKR